MADLVSFVVAINNTAWSLILSWTPPPLNNLIKYHDIMSCNRRCISAMVLFYKWIICFLRSVGNVEWSYSGAGWLSDSKYQFNTWQMPGKFVKEYWCIFLIICSCKHIHIKFVFKRCGGMLYIHRLQTYFSYNYKFWRGHCRVKPCTKCDILSEI